MRQIVEAFGIKPQFETDTIPQNIVSGCSIMGMAYKTNACYVLYSSALYIIIVIMNRST